MIENKVTNSLNKRIEYLFFYLFSIKESLVLFSLSILIGLALLFTVTGCSSVKEVPVTVKSSEIKTLSLPEKFKENCTVPIPPNKEEYLKSSSYQKENLLTTYIGELLTELNNCNKRIKSINKYIDESNELLKK